MLEVCRAQEANDGVAQRSHNVGKMALTYLRRIFIKRDILHPMRLALDVPVLADVGQQRFGGDCRGAGADDAIDDFRSSLPTPGHRAFQTEHLLYAWPGQVVIEFGGGR